MQNKKALVLGGTKNIGLETALMLRDCGADVKVVGRHNPHKEGIDFVEYDFDTFIENNLEPIKPYIQESDILVVAYGPFIQKPLELTEAADWEKMAVQNLALPGACVSVALSKMKERGYGRIILFGGTRTYSVYNYKTNCAYASAKTGISVLTKSVASEYAEYGITCNALFPGFTSDAPKDTQIVQPQKIAECIKFLILNAELNGILFNVDRGWQF